MTQNLKYNYQMSNFLVVYEALKKMKIIYSVPQGLVLRPLIFLLFINDLPENIYSKTLVINVDATSLEIYSLVLKVFKVYIKNIVNSFINWS